MDIPTFVEDKSNPEYNTKLARNKTNNIFYNNKFWWILSALGISTFVWVVAISYHRQQQQKEARERYLKWKRMQNRIAKNSSSKTISSTSTSSGSAVTSSSTSHSSSSGTLPQYLPLLPEVPFTSVYQKPVEDDKAKAEEYVEKNMNIKALDVNNVREFTNQKIMNSEAASGRKWDPETMIPKVTSERRKGSLLEKYGPSIEELKVHLPTQQTIGNIPDNGPLRLRQANTFSGLNEGTPRSTAPLPPYDDKMRNKARVPKSYYNTASKA